eukprot:TRINITY_DN522_c2_g1_i1.p2 TRINITY_DN522_c2_g1~~TRINITY_DN522_c2_g1_i1.p2  ORF type:complete len:565 (-),score=266.89 TRINITY_DN522_c2_g1_i1:2099-3793(-)
MESELSKSQVDLQSAATIEDLEDIFGSEDTATHLDAAAADDDDDGVLDEPSGGAGAAASTVDALAHIFGSDADDDDADQQPPHVAAATDDNDDDGQQLQLQRHKKDKKDKKAKKEKKEKKAKKDKRDKKDKKDKKDKNRHGDARHVHKQHDDKAGDEPTPGSADTGEAADESVQTLVKSIFGDSDDDDDDAPADAADAEAPFDDEADADAEASAAERLARLAAKKKKHKRSRSDDDDDADATDSRRKKRRGGGDGDNKRRQGQAAAADADADATDSFGSQQPAKAADFFDTLIAGIKSGRRRKRTQEEDEALQQWVLGFRDRIESAADLDDNANRAKQPAVHKLKLLPELLDQLAKKEVQLRLLEKGVLALLRRWLEPLPDGSLPNLNVRQAVLQLLDGWSAPLELEELRDSQLGKAVMRLYRHPAETPGNKRLAHGLIDRWSRPIFGIQMNYKSIDPEHVVQVMPDDSSGRRGAGRVLLDAARGGNEVPAYLLGVKDKAQHARIPQPMPLDFKKRPVANIDQTQLPAPKPKQRAGLERHLQNLRRSSQAKQARAVVVSLSGER